MTDVEKVPLGRFCWLDLAATDAASAARFYSDLFGWTPQEHRANGGIFTRLRSGDQDVASLYQIQRQAVARGASSHWTAYVRVADVDDVACRVSEIGGTVLVQPSEVSGIARIALIADPVGAQFGLWGPLESVSKVTSHA
jgi:uncharacterized protein